MIVLLVGTAVFAVTFVWSCCKVAGEADERERKLLEELKSGHESNED